MTFFEKFFYKNMKEKQFDIVFDVVREAAKKNIFFNGRPIKSGRKVRGRPLRNK